MHYPFNWQLFPSICPGVGLLDHEVVLFLKILHHVSHTGYTNLHSHQQCSSISFSPHPWQQLICVLLDDCYFGRCEGVTSFGVDLHFFEDYRCKASFSVAVCHLYFFFGKNVYWDLCPFLNEVVFFLFAIQLYEFFIYFRY